MTMDLSIAVELVNATAERRYNHPIPSGEANPKPKPDLQRQLHVNSTTRIHVAIDYPKLISTGAKQNSSIVKAFGTLSWGD